MRKSMVGVTAAKGKVETGKPVSKTLNVSAISMHALRLANNLTVVISCNRFNGIDSVGAKFRLSPFAIMCHR